MVTIKDMLDSGVHFGHQIQRWNPKMKPYVFGNRRGIHIIDLQKTLKMTKKALKAIEDMAAQGHRLIFVGTKKQAVDVVQEAAKKCQQFFVTKRWLGGTLTNFVTIKQSIDRLKKIDQMREKGDLKYFSKKEQAHIEKEYSKLNEYLEGIREMKEPPAMIFIVDVIKEHIAVREAKKMGVSVFGLCDTNSNPEEVDYPIPANDDAIRSIRLFCNLVSDAYLVGAERWEEKLRVQTDNQTDNQTDKQSDVEVEEKAGKEKEDLEKRRKGPSVIRASKGRKLVAVGTADEIEIRHEVETEAVENKKPDEEKTNKADGSSEVEEKIDKADGSSEVEEKIDKADGSSEVEEKTDKTDGNSESDNQTDG